MKSGKDVVRLVAGAFAGQGLVVLAAPVLTRMYLPSDFGVLVFYVSIISAFSVVVGLRYDAAITIANTEEEAFYLTALSSFSSFILSILFYALAIVCVRFNVVPQEYVSYVWIVPISVFSIGVFNALSAYAVRRKSYKVIAKSKVTQGAAQVLGQLLFGWLGFGAAGLLAGDMLGRIVTIPSVFKVFKESFGNFSSWPKSFCKAIEIATTFRSFPLVSTWAILFNSVSVQMPAMLVGGIFGSNVAGYFGLTQRVVAGPLRIISLAVQQVFIGNASSLIRDRQKGLFRLCSANLVKLSVLSFAVLLSIYFLPRDAFVFIFGSGWSESYEYIRILAVMFSVQFIVVPISQTLVLLRYQNIQLLWDVTRLLTLVLMTYLVVDRGMSPFEYFVGLSFVMIFFYVLLLLLVLRFTAKFDKSHGLLESKSENREV